MAEPARPLMTVAEFLEWDDGTDTRHELIHGVPVAMAPASPAHAFLAGNVAGLLYGRLRPPCRTALEAGIARPEAASDSFLVADLAIACAPQPREAQSIIDPVVIVEVLSPSTVGQDRDAAIPLDSVGVDLPLAELYRDVPV